MDVLQFPYNNSVCENPSPPVFEPPVLPPYKIRSSKCDH